MMIEDSLFNIIGSLAIGIMLIYFAAKFNVGVIIDTNDDKKTDLI